MATILEPLRILVSSRPSVISKASQLFTSTEPLRKDTLREVRPLRSAGELEPPEWNGNRNVGDVEGSVQDGRVSHDSRLGQKTEPLFLETKYGLRLELTDQQQETVKISTIPQKIQEQPSLISKARQLPRYHYRLFPDWQTSYLWYDMSRTELTDDVDDPYVDEDIIEERYPTLSPYFDSWRQAYEVLFEKHECHLSSGKEVFDDAADRVSWDVQGLLIACWLVLQEDVGSVEYSPRSEKYRVEKNKINGDLPKFLSEIMREEAAVAQPPNYHFYVDD